jgi:hypothetical protein
VKRRLLIAALTLAGCGGARGGPASAPTDDAPLNSFASLRLIVLPTQGVRSGDVLGWAAKSGDRRAFLASVDSALESAVRDRGLSSWALASDLARTARRNPLFATNPAEVRAADAVRFLERKRDSEIPEPVASQLRALAGFHDARYALVPVEVRFEPGGSAGSGHGVLRVAVLDVRGSRLVFVGDIAGSDAPDFSPSLGAELARRFTDLVVPR